jgi:hypothetical protein
MHIALTIIEHQTFRELMLYLCPALEPFIVHSKGVVGHRHNSAVREGAGEI